MRDLHHKLRMNFVVPARSKKSYTSERCRTRAFCWKVIYIVDWQLAKSVRILSNIFEYRCLHGFTAPSLALPSKCSKH